MMMYTKGEWRVKEFTQCHHGEHDIGIIAISRISGLQVCGLERDYSYPISMPKEQVLANAHLISAAPDMYEAAKKVMTALEKHGGSIVPHLMDTDDNAGQELREALAKAEGKQ
jgi:hypothetical protein